MRINLKVCVAGYLHSLNDRHAGRIEGAVLNRVNSKFPRRLRCNEMGMRDKAGITYMDLACRKTLSPRGYCALIE